MSDDKPISLLKRIVAIVPTMAFAMQPMFAFANPQGGVVSAGDATISSTGKKLDIIQRSDKAVIDWRNFDINSDEATEFHQLSSSSIALNRVNSDSASHINGNLTANGNIVILNQNGVMFGAGAKVDVNGLVVSTAGISNDAFMNSNGVLHFDQAGNENASIINNGTITAKEAGLVGMVAPNVVNNGIITAKLGRVHLASGDTFTVDMYGDNLMEVAVSDKVKSQLVENTGVISAAGGKIGITAAAGKDIVSSLINVKGELHAPAVAQKNGEIFIYAAGSHAVKGNVSSDKAKKTGSSTVLVQGTVDASGKGAGEQGGSISILGDNVGLLTGTLVDASGTNGGGTIKIGGDYHGGGDTPTAYNTVVQSGVNIFADALMNGNGGKVTLWADNYTSYLGNITARGGLNSGDGGFVEVSGKETLNFHGTVDTQAINGKSGMLLLDPATLTIRNGSGDGAADGTTTFQGTPSGTIGSIFAADTGPSSIYESELEAMSASTNIYLQATGGITINNLSTDGNLNLAQDSGHSVTFDAGAGAFTMANTANTITTAGGALTIISSTGASSIGNLTTGAGTITLNIGGTATASGIISTSGGVVQTGGGQVTYNNANTFTGGLAIKSGTAKAINFATAFGAGSIYLGDTSGSNNATLLLSSNTTTVYSNNIVLVSGTTGALTLTTTANGSVNQTFSGDITGTGNLIIDNELNTHTLVLNGANINFTGTLTNTGSTTSHTTQIDAVIGTNVTGVIQNSAGKLVLTAANTFSNGLTIKSGEVRGTTDAANFGAGTITLGDTSGSTNATLTASGFTFANAIVLSSGTTGTLAIQGLSLANTTFSGGVTGTNNLTLLANTSKTLTFSGASVNNTGTITNATTTNGNTTISAAIGSNVTGIIQNSSTGKLTLSGTNTNYAGTTTIAAGTLNFTSGALGSTGDITFTGGTLQYGTSNTLDVSSRIKNSSSAIRIDNVANNVTFASTINANNTAGMIVASSSTGAFTLSGNNTWGGDVSLTTNGGVLTVSGTQAMGANNLTLQTDSDLALSAAISGTGNLIIKPTTSSTTLGIGTASGSTLNLTSTEMGNITSGWNSVTFGAAGNTGAVALTTATFADATSIYGGAFTFNNNLTANKGLTLGSTSAMTLNKTINTTTGNVLLQSTTNITLSSTITTTSGSITIDADSDANSTGWINVGANLTTTGGHIYLGGGADATTGYTYGDSTSGTQYGIKIGSVTIDSGSGNLTMHGHGGSYASGGNYGIYVANAATLKSTGTTSLYGVGGSTSNNNYGFIALAAALTITNVSNLNIYGTGGASAGTGNSGIYLSSGNLTSAGSGAINLNGAAGSGTSNYGVFTTSTTIGGVNYSGNIAIVSTAGDIALSTTQTSSTGTLLVKSTDSISTGILTTAGTNIVVNSDSDANSSGFITITGNLTSGGGNIILGGGADATTGYAYGNGSTAYGINMNTAVTIDAGAGNITMHGHGGTTGNLNTGVYETSAVTLKGNAVDIYGVGGGSASSPNSWGIAINGTTLTVTNVTTLNMYGTGGTGSGGNHYGIAFYTTNANLTSAGSGSMTFTGVGGSGGSSNYSLYSNGGSSYTIGGTSYTGDMTFIGDTISLANSMKASTSGSSTIWFKPYSTGTTVGIAGGGTSPTLAVTATVLNLVTSPNVKIGRSDGTAAFTVAARTWTSNVTLLNGSGGIVFSGAQSDGTNTLTAVTSGNITLNSGATITSTATSGNSIVLAAGGNFINNAGASALTAGTSTARWIVYSTQASSDTNGASQLNPAATTYNQTYATLAPGSVSGTGNAWVYSSSPAGIITFTADNKVRLYGDSNPTLTYTFTCSTGCLAVDAITGAPALATAATGTTGVGTATITASAGTVALTGAYSGYTVNYSSGTLTINKAHLTVTADSGKSMTYGANALPTLTATISGYKNSENATSAGVTGSAALSTAATAYNGAAGSGSNAGTYDIIAAANNLNAANYDFTYVNAINGLTVNKAILTATANNQNRLYGQNNPTFTQTITGYANGDTSAILTGSATGSSTATNTTGIGTYTITGSTGTLDAGSNYTLAAANGTLTINKAHLTVTADDKSMTYGGNALPGLTSTITGYVNSEDATSAGVTGSATLGTVATAYNGTAGSGSNAGTYAITAAANNLAAANYDFAYTNGTLTVNKAILTATANNQNRLYGQNNPTFTQTITGYANGDTSAILTGSATGSSTATNTTGIGTYAITGSTGTLDAGSNYTLAAANGTLTINKAHLTVTADGGKSMTYGGNALPTLTSTITGYVNSEDATSAGVTGSATLSTAATAYNGTAGSGSNAGTYDIIAAAHNLAAANYDFTYVNAVNGLTINKAILTVAANNQNRLYGQNNPSFTQTITGYANGDTSSVLTGSATGSSAATNTTGVGAYTINGSTGTLGSVHNNYTFVAANGTLTINKAHLLVTANNKSMTYGDSTLPGLSSTITGYVNGENATSAGVSGSATLATAVTAYNGTPGSGSNAGTYAITASAHNLAAANYDFAYANGIFTVNRAQLAVVADAKTVVNTTTEPALTYSYTGLVAGDTAASFTGALAHTNGFGAGTYSIYRNTLAATGNYVIGSYTPGVFTVTGGPSISDISNALPTSVSRVAQDGSLNKPVDISYGALGATATTILWHEGADVPTLSRTSRKSKPLFTNGLTLLSPSASDPMNDEMGATYNMIEILEE